jgi:hypothetical protein
MANNLAGDLALSVKEEGAVLAGGWIYDVGSPPNRSNVIRIGLDALADTSDLVGRNEPRTESWLGGRTSSER